MSHVQRRLDHSRSVFLKRTVAAQIHLRGALAAMAGVSYLCYLTWRAEVQFEFWACAIFGGTAILVFAISSIYHFLHDGYQISAKLEALFEDLDHFSIYLFIAGTYTPVLLRTLTGSSRDFMISAVWVIAFIGITYTRFKERLPAWAQHRFFSTSLFIVMGWILLVKAATIFDQLSTFGMTALLAGGFAYTLGAVIYALKRPNFFPGVFGSHEIWHAMVLIGFISHYLLVLDFFEAF